MAVHDHNLTMDNDNENLITGKGSPDLIRPKDGPVHISDHSKESTSVMATTNSDVVKSTVESSNVLPSQFVAVTTVKEVVQETARRQLLVN